MAPAPWEKSPSEEWADNFIDRVEAITDNAQTDEAADAYVAGVLSRVEEGSDVTASSIRDSQGYNSWLEAIDNFSDEAIQRSVVAAAGRVDPDNQFPETYDEASAADFENAVRDVLAQKFIDNWEAHYE